jgi:peptidoglycan LD-endopeptidase LytH
MRRKGPRSGSILPGLAAAFSVGIVVGWWLHSGAPLPNALHSRGLEAVGSASPGRVRAYESGDVRPDDTGTSREPQVAATTGEPLVGPAPAPASAVVADLKARDLRVPIDDAKVETMKGGFEARRDRGARPHEAVDILAPRNTPVHAVEDGTIAKLFLSKAGGITIYQFDPTGRYCYYYAHLDHYTSGLKEGLKVSRGEVIGYVGSTGNASPSAPHLHFSIFELDQDRRWWKGRAIDPYLIFTP